MKRFLKAKAKRTLSLFLAVVMLMSCWVWVAPEKAAAADRNNGEYQVRLMAKCPEDDGNVTSLTAKVYYGDSGSKDMTTYPDNLSGTATTGDAYSILAAACDLPGFPTKFEMAIACACSDGKGPGGYYFQLQVYDNKNDKWVIVNNDPNGGIGWSEIKSEAKSIGSDDGRTHTMDAVKPVATYVELSSGAMESKTMPTIPKIGATNTSEVSVACTAAGVYDQYYVKMGGLTPSYYVSTDVAGSTTCESDKTKDNYKGIWASGNTVKANADVQTKLTSTTGSNKVYLIGTYGDIKSAVSEITLTYPKYVVTVNQNGSIANLGAEMEMSNGDKRTASWSGNGYYGTSVAPYPKGTASKVGYTFKGFWTAPQPTSGDAAYNAFEADFANPVDTATFNTYAAQDGASQNGNVVTLADGSIYYNAGTQWNPDKHKQIIGDTTFYGWWISQDITVKFYDIDGKFLGLQTSKYGNTEGESWYPNPKDSYNAGAFEYNTFAKKWRDITGAIIEEGSYTFGPLASLSLTPIYVTGTYNDKYTVSFVNPANGNVDEQEYNYRDDVENLGGKPEYTMPGTLRTDIAYSYELIGWTTQKPAEGNYHVVSKGDATVAINNDWTVREDVTYYAVYESTIKSYLVGFEYKDATGTTRTDVKVVPYGSAISTPNEINKSYNVGGVLKTLLGWNYLNASNTDAELGVDNTIIFNKDNVSITADNLSTATPEKPIIFTAVYDAGRPMPFAVTFKYKDSKGAEKIVTAEVENGEAIAQATVDKLVVPAQYDDGTALYTFSGNWEVTAGQADKASYETSDLTSFVPTSDITFEAAYDDGVPFYTVTYIDGTKTYSERVTAGTTLPAWIVKDAEGKESVYVPADKDDVAGVYKFAGWYDEKQADEEEKATNGTKYTETSVINSDVTLYSQFEFEAFKFTIKFMDYTGKVQLAIAEVEAGQSFAPAFYEATRAAQYRAPDNTHSYEFIGWDNYYNEDNLVCEGKDVTYTAQYRASYIYYKANWYNSKDEMTAPLATTNYIYEGKIYAPSVDLTVPAGKAFDGWYYLKDGVETKYERGMTITSDMNFYAKYKDADVLYTVTTVVDGKSTAYKVEKGKTADIIGKPADGYLDAEHHRTFTGWYTAATCDCEEQKVECTHVFDIATEAINADKTIYARFVNEQHSNVIDEETGAYVGEPMRELVSEPTYYVPGAEYVWCACSRDKTVAKDENGDPITTAIPVLTDTVAPTGTIYLGESGKWTSTETDPAKTGAGDPNIYYANADTDFILTINDKGDINNAYNSTGEGIGIRNIRVFVSGSTFTAADFMTAQKLAITIYPTDGTLADTSETQNNVANYTFKAGDFKLGELDENGQLTNVRDLVDGEKYIAYYYAIDKAGNELNRNVRTAAFIYDTTAPKITFTKKDCNDDMTIFCEEAVITDIEEGATLEINGKKIEYTGDSYTVTGAGNYVVTLTDRAGNKETKKISINNGHKEVTTEKVADCTTDGYKTVTCAICKKEISKTTTISNGHQYGAKETIAADCFKGGYDVETCTVCGDEKITNQTAKLDHQYAKDDAGNIIYTVITAVTCSTDGKLLANCTLCGKGTIIETVDADGTSHVYGAVKTLKPTCDRDGEKYRICKYCYYKDSIEKLDQLNHVDTGRYTAVTKEATCCEEGVLTTYCKDCDAVMGTEAIAMIAHTLKLITYDSEADKSEAYPHGYTQYECQAKCQADGAQCEYVEGKAAIVPNAEKEEYTLTFVGAAADGTDVVITVTEGESIAIGAVEDQEKASDNTFNYAFEGWKAASDGKIYKLPIKATKNETYTAEFTATKRVYTHIFLVEDDTVAAAGTEKTYIEFATIVGTYNSTNKKPVAEPTKASTATASYKFAGWVLKDDNTVVDDFTMVEDKVFVAKFDTILTEFNVVFYNEGNNLIWNTTVNNTENVKYDNKDDEGNLIVPTKACDDSKHYAFTGWTYNNTVYAIDADLGKVAKDTRIYATFAGTEHTLVTVNDADKTWAATCTAAGQTTKRCECGYEVVTAVPTIDHNYELQEDGSKKCSMCGDVIAPEVKEVTITFKEGEEILKAKKVAEGKETSYIAPVKASTAEFTYSFLHWIDAAGNVVTEEAEITVTAGTEDAVYYAVYSSETRTYSVTYFDNAGNVITTSKIAYNGVVPEAPSADKAIAVKYDDYYHFEFNGWDVAAGTIVTGEIMINPVIIKTAHDYDDGVVEDATCTNPGGTRFTCDCGYSYTNANTTPADHDWGEEIVVDPTYDAPGSITKVCSVCGATDEKVIPQLKKNEIRVTVKNSKGDLVEGAKVDLYKDGTWVAVKYSDKNGLAVFQVAEDGKYTVIISGVEGSSNSQFDVSTGESVESQLKEESCKCGCHRPGFWGAVYRFFYKIVKFFTGRDCCTH